MEGIRGTAGGGELDKSRNAEGGGPDARLSRWRELRGEAGGFDDERMTLVATDWDC